MREKQPGRWMRTRPRSRRKVIRSLHQKPRKLARKISYNCQHGIHGDRCPSFNCQCECHGLK